MSKANGMIEFKTTATGITAADAMVKTSDVEIVEAFVLICGYSCINCSFNCT